MEIYFKCLPLGNWDYAGSLCRHVKSYSSSGAKKSEGREGE